MDDPNTQNIAGIILVGGRSSRMGKNKALLNYNGKPLIDHMIGILKQTNIQSILISGDIKGYECIPDETPFSGPAVALSSIIDTQTNYDRFLCIPIDMPHLNAHLLNHLLNHKNGAYFENHPLPALVIRSKKQCSNADSIKDLLTDYQTPSIPLPDSYKAQMINTNTPEQWKEAIQQ